MIRFLCFFALFLSTLAGGCASTQDPLVNEAVQRRAGPMYVQWMEKQSAVFHSRELAAIVSGSRLSWTKSGAERPLPEGADVWLRVSPVTATWANGSFFSRLAGDGLPARLAALGIRGIFFTGVAETGDEWKGRSPAEELGQDAISLGFGHASGTEKEYADLGEALAGSGILTGGQLFPPAPGMGADFALALRNVREYPGMFSLMEVPSQEWPLLPKVEEEDWAALDIAMVRTLRQRGILPEALVTELNTRETGGWMVSGSVVGVDGQARRWICRWSLSPHRPVMHWDDPSCSARRVMESSAILEAGLRHSALLGLRMEAWAGLEVASLTTTPKERLEPAGSALRDLTRHIHHYGAAVLVEDVFSPEAVSLLQACGADAIRDPFMEPALSRSLLRENAAPLQKALRRSLSLNVDHARLWRGPRDGMPDPEALPLPPEWAPLLEHKGRLRLNAPTLAALVCGLAPGMNPDPDQLSALLDIHELQIALNALMPGLLMLSGSDLSVSVSEGHSLPAVPPSWALDPSPVTRQGLPAGRALAKDAALLRGKPLPEMRLKNILALRASSGVARGTFIDAPDAGDPGVIALLSRLPSGKLLTVFGNFSSQNAEITPPFPEWNGSSRTDALSGQAAGISFSLPAWGWRAFYLPAR